MGPDCHENAPSGKGQGSSYQDLSCTLPLLPGEPRLARATPLVRLHPLTIVSCVPAEGVAAPGMQAAVPEQAGLQDTCPPCDISD